MTREEYEALNDEYWKSDSISRREEIEEKIATAAKALFNCVRDIFDRYHARKELISDDDYRDDRGWLCLAHEDDGEPIFDKSSILLHYGDRWAYGGECGFGIRVYAKWFDPEERKKLAAELKTKRIASLERAIENIKKEIEYKQKALQETVDAVTKLKTEEDAADNIELDDD